MKNEVPGAITPLQPDGGDALALSTKVDDTLLQSLVWMAAYHGKPTSEAAMLSGLPAGRFISPKQAQLAMEQSGFSVGVIERQPNEVSPMLLPVVLFRKDHGGCVLIGRSPTDVKLIKPASEIKEGEQPQDEMEAAYLVVLPEAGSKVVAIGVSQLKANYTGFAMLVKPVGRVDIRAGKPEAKENGHWLLSTLWRYRRYYWSAALGALLINVLALAGTFFTMNVYDRVVPNQAFTTLWSLAIGVAIAMLFEFISRNVRAHVLDVAGKKADLIMGAMLFKQALSIRMEHKPASSGSFANQLREFESVRDFVASATLATISDLPFTFLYIAVIFMIAGPLGFIPLALIPVIVGVSLFIQWPLKKTMKENLRESSLKQGVLIETVEGIETLKATGGERYMQERWELFSAKASDTSMKSKRLSALATNFVMWITQFETVMIVVAGVYLIADGKLTQGALIGSVILASRALAPLAQVTGLAVRFQQSKAALDSLSGLMKKPVERDPEVDYLDGPVVTGAVELKGVGFGYPAPNGMKPPEFLKNINIKIEAGERIAILGRVGSGKSSLLRVMSNLYRPTSGQIFSDGIDLSQIDPSDWRASVGYVAQDKYDSSAHTKVTLGGTGAPVTLSNVATGVADNDAVNVAQLNTGLNSVLDKTTVLNNALKYVGFGPSLAAYANASGTDSMALGGNAYATADRSLAIGLNARAGYADSVAIGTNSTVTAANTVSIGSAGKERRIMFVATGIKTTDAVNLGQVQSMIAALTPVQQQQVLQSPVAMSVLSATKLGASAQNWTDVLATGDTDKAGQTTAVGTDAMAIGLNTHATGAHATAIGQNTHADADGSVAIGNGSLSNGIEATAVGVNSSVTVDHALAVGYSAMTDAEDGIAIGSGATVGGGADAGVAIGKEAVVTGAGSFALGNNTTVSGTNSFVLGSNNMNVTGKNSVVLGSGSDGSQDNVISVGAKGSERKIVNVAAGTTTTDAVNLGQMTKAIAAAGTGGGGSTLITQDSTSNDLLVGGTVDGTHVNFASTSGAARELINVAAGTTNTSAVNLSQLAPVVAGLGGGAKIDPTTGAVTGPTYTIQGSTVHNAGDAFTKVDAGLSTLTGQVAAITADSGGLGLVAQDASTRNITVGATTNGGVVDVTGTAGTRKITGVTAGDVDSSSVDAINGSQLAATSQSFATAIGGGSMMNTEGSITLPSFSVGTSTFHNVGDAITGLDGRINTTNDSLTTLQTQVTNITSGGGVATPNAVAYDSAAHDALTLSSTAGGTTKLSGLTDGTVAEGSTDAVTGNQLYAVQNTVDSLQTSVTNISTTGSTVIGINGINGTDGTNAAPTAASATGSDAIAMGDNASASGDHAVVIGGGASGTADGTIAIGGNAGASGKDSIAIGNGATAPNANSVALGAGSTTDRDNSVSVGSADQQRQITNVAAGTQGTDAVNLNQMNSAVGGIACKAYSGIAAATALTMIPDVDANKTLSLGIGGGTFQGYAATAIGGTARITQNIKVRVGAGWSAAGTTVGAGASYQW